MLKKILKSCVISVTLFCFSMNVYSYTFIDSDNESRVNELITEIYDSKEQYEDLAGYRENDDLVILESSSDSYWWPIGSVETTTVNGIIFATGDPETVHTSSPYGYRTDPFGRGTKLHSGQDISGGHLNMTNIIAAKDGIVVYPTSGIKNDCPSGNSLSSCGNGYGNYVIIQHSDGNYTLYGHMYEGSITVTAGDSVKQGQVIGKMGSSGNSTGAHLHFEVREGQNAFKATVDPLNYISADNPREVLSQSSSGEFLSWINSWEGTSPIEGDNYIVEDIGDGVRTVGGGVTLEHNVERFLSHGIDVSLYPVGSRIPISIVDQVELEELAKDKSYIENILSNNSITLNQTQLEALVSMTYNCGNINGFAKAYKTYGATEKLWDNWFYRCVSKGTKFEKGLTRRRNAEWQLFYNGVYVYNK